MGVSVTLTVHDKDDNRSFSYTEPMSVFVGRNSECGITFGDKTVSRYHCLLDIVPPSVRVRDFGSLNGTYVNDALIGKRAKDQSIEEAREKPGILVDLSHGDKLRLGSACEIGITITSDLVCNKCHRKVGLQLNDFVETDSKNILCLDCKKKEDEIKAEQDKRQAERKKAEMPKPAVVGQVNNKPAGLPVVSEYKMVRRIGRGGMGEVWLAEKEGNGKQYAIKRMLPQVAAISSSRDAFLREAALSSQLKHNNIVAQYESKEDKNGLYIVMEYCVGGSVSDVMNKAHQLFTVEDALNCTLQVLNGLAYAHDARIESKVPNGSTKITHGLVHRDFKPSNIFVQNENGQIIYKVADFGLAKAFELAGLSGYTKAGQIAGTPSFMPRQQVLDFKFSKPEVDIWACAASLYFMLTGFVPKQDNKTDPWLAAVMNQAVPIRKRNPKIPKKLAEVIDQALVDNPGITFKNAESLIKELKPIYEGIRK